VRTFSSASGLRPGFPGDGASCVESLRRTSFDSTDRGYFERSVTGPGTLRRRPLKRHNHKGFARLLLVETASARELLRMAFNDVPGRVFLDTCVVNFILDYGEQIHEGISLPDGVGERVVRDIEALYNIFLVGQRAMWQLAISPHTYQEVASTRDAHRRYHLQSWFADLWQHWRDVIHEENDLPTFADAEDIRVRVLASGVLDVLPDMADRVLVCDALVYRCDVFCTRDWTTVLQHRARLKDLPLEIVTPAEWWVKIRPYARLWA
jgi:hypothetical protein